MTRETITELVWGSIGLTCLLAIWITAWVALP